MNPTTPTRADALTEGDIILHQGAQYQVYTEPGYLTRGMVFDALPLDFGTGETQEICLHPEEVVQLVSYQSRIVTPVNAA